MQTDLLEYKPAQPDATICTFQCCCIWNMAPDSLSGRFALSLNVRQYLFADDGLVHIAKRLTDALIDGEEALPQFAGTKQRVADVIIEYEGGEPIRIARTFGYCWHFDEEGRIHKDCLKTVAAAMDAAAASRSKVWSDGVVDLGPQLKRDKLKRENTWELTSEDLDLISNDLWPERHGDPAKRAKRLYASTPRRVALTAEAHKAYVKIACHLSTIVSELRELPERSLKGLIAKADEEARSIKAQSGLWEGVAKAAEHQRGIQERHRTGTGQWIALVERVAWNSTRTEGSSIVLAFEESGSREAAEKAVQRLLAAHAKEFRHDVAIEARVFCDLEFTDRYEGVTLHLAKR